MFANLTCGIQRKRGVAVLSQQLHHLRQCVFELGLQCMGRVDQEHAAGWQTGAHHFTLVRPGELAGLDRQRGVQPRLAGLVGHGFQALGHDRALQAAE